MSSETETQAAPVSAHTVILPDCRLTSVLTAKNAVQGPGGSWLPFFCANCGVEGGLCPEANMTFAFYLCPNCEKHGEIPGMVMMPDEVFFQNLHQEQLAMKGRPMTEAEMYQAVIEDSSSLATLLKERDRQLCKT